MKTLIALFLFFASLPPACHAGTEDLLMGSVVKSDKWKMDRANDREIFEGAVSFHNALYDLKADHAVYDRGVKSWTITGSVYCMRRFPDGSTLELNCEKGKYSESLENAQLYRGASRIRMKHVAPDGKVLKARCDMINAENSGATMDLLGNLDLITENMALFAQNGHYSDKEKSFLIYDSTPIAIGTKEGYDFAFTGQRIKFFRDTGDVKLYNNVAGWIKAGTGQ